MKYFRIILAFSIISMLVFSSCNININVGENQEEPSEEQSTSSVPEEKPETEPEPEEPESDWDVNEKSYKELIDRLVFSGDLFAEAFIGYIEGPMGTGYTEFFEERGYMELYPFINDIPYERYIEAGGNEMYCIVPKYMDSSVEVYEWLHDAESENYYAGELLYESKTGEPFFVICNEHEYIPNSYVIITDPDGTKHDFIPNLDLNDEWLSVYESDLGFSYDFSCYENSELYGVLFFDDLVGNWAEQYTDENGETINILFDFYYSEMYEPKIIFQYGKENGEIIAYYEGMVYDEESGYDGKITGNLVLDLTLTGGTLFDEEGDGFYRALYNFRRSDWDREIVIASCCGGIDIMPGYEIGFMELERAYG